MCIRDSRRTEQEGRRAVEGLIADLRAGGDTPLPAGESRPGLARATADRSGCLNGDSDSQPFSAEPTTEFPGEPPDDTGSLPVGTKCATCAKQLRLPSRGACGHHRAPRSDPPRPQAVPCFGAVAGLRNPPCESGTGHGIDFSIPAVAYRPPADLHAPGAKAHRSIPGVVAYVFLWKSQYLVRPQ